MIAVHITYLIIEVGIGTKSCQGCFSCGLFLRLVRWPRMFFKWLHLPLISRQLAVIHHTTSWWVCMAMELAALCDMWRWKWHQWMPFGCFQCWHSLFLPLCEYPPAHPSLPPHGSASGIGYASKTTIWIDGQFSYVAIHLIVGE